MCHRYEDASSHLCAAADAGDMRQLTRLIDNKVDPNIRDYDQRTALHIAARRGSIKVVDYLVSQSVEINAVDRQVIHSLWWLSCRADPDPLPCTQHKLLCSSPIRRLCCSWLVVPLLRRSPYNSSTNTTLMVIFTVPGVNAT